MGNICASPVMLVHYDSSELTLIADVTSGDNPTSLCERAAALRGKHFESGGDVAEGFLTGDSEEAEGKV